MLGTGRLFGAFSVALVTFAAAASGCGDDDPANPTGPGGSSSTGGTGGSGGSVTCAPGEATTLALTELQFGHGESGQWKKVGLNIDGLVSTGNSTDVCQPNSAALPYSAFPDGDNGIDNSFGKNLLPIILGLRPEWPAEVNDNLEQGEFNALVKMYCLPESGDIAGMTTKIFGGTKLDHTPVYDGTDEWPVAPELLADPEDPESSTIIFPASSVVESSFDSGKNQSFIFTLPIHFGDKDTTVKLTLHAAQVLMELSEDRKTATGGVIAGVLDTEEFVYQVKKIGWVNNMCGSSLDTVLLQVRQASDIMADGTQDPTKTCNGISIGVHFEMKEVLIGEVGPAAEPGQACP